MAALPHRRAHLRIFPLVLASLVALAWAALWAWTRSPYGRYLEHDGWTASGPAAALCRALPGGAVWLPAVFSAAAWTLMILAMMLPTTLSLFNAFARIVAGRPDRARLLVLLGAGVAQVPALAWRGWVIGAAVFALAGAFQFSALKTRCLDRCRTPLSFVISHWRGRAPHRQAFALGGRHGLFCVGCCWALMLLMFVVGAGSLGWMLALAAAMAVEKNAAWGRRLTAPLGFALLAGAALIAAGHL
ncbi:hypothetical protein WT81_02335 [Burkholderia stagnalis]|uniref:DUF2182 domain-containing protein n=1 Tax=Burkholderia stagnalis TaxID=1503054 RepID=UPI00075F8BB6|nr:DUF2182 domain-containing protein [Burkholderia stagnalis]KWK48919.1 hypothetical protein WT80_15160 [Burkholderia stagnalis]KWK66157.1 hypothetical protein WT81_02335 [Burkholderia stagnalis]